MNAREIMSIWDQNAPLYFPRINDAKQRVSDVRMTALRSSAGKWALVIEMFGFLPVMVGDERFIDAVTIFYGQSHRGANAKGRETRDHFPIRSHPKAAISPGGISYEVVVSDPTIFFVRDVLHAISGAEFKRARVVDGKRVVGAEVFAKKVASMLGDGVFLTIEQITDICGQDLAPLIRVAAWHHPDIRERELPSHMESFQSLAEAIACGDPFLFRPGVPNTDIKHWEVDYL